MMQQGIASPRSVGSAPSWYEEADRSANVKALVGEYEAMVVAIGLGQKAPTLATVDRMIMIHAEHFGQAQYNPGKPMSTQDLYGAAF